MVQLLAIYSDLRSLDIEKVDVASTDSRIIDLIAELKAVIGPPQQP